MRIDNSQVSLQFYSGLQGNNKNTTSDDLSTVGSQTAQKSRNSIDDALAKLSDSFHLAQANSNVSSSNVLRLLQ